MDKNYITNKILLINEAISKLKYFAQLYGINSIFIVGGYCRSLYADRLWEVNDIDVASAYEHQATELGGLFASEILNAVPQFYHRTKTMMVNYTSELGEIKIEFQGQSTQDYMYNIEVKDWLHKNGIDDNPLLHNVYGRDFTINALIYSLQKENLYDITDRAEKDFSRKKIVSLLPAELTVKYNPLTILRAIRLALAYGFRIQHEFEQQISIGHELLIKSVSTDRIIQEVIKILKIDGRKAIKFLKKYGLHKLLLNDKIKELLN